MRARLLAAVAAATLQGTPSQHGMAMQMPMPASAGGFVTIPIRTDGDRLLIDLPGGALPPATPGDEMGSMALPPVAIAVIPRDVWLYGFRVDIVDSGGHTLPAALLHHLNVATPDARELFLPIERRLLAAGEETGEQKAPWMLFGIPFKRGDRLLVNSMLHNATAVNYPAAHARLVMYFVPGGRPWPLFRAYPWQLDCAFPVGDKTWDLPPGRSSHSYEGRPAIAGSILAIGGHLHEYGTRLTFTDVTADKVIWSGIPLTDSAGEVTGMPTRKFVGLTHVGVHIDPSHVYRVTAEYDNPTGHVIPEGAMGVVGGLFRPDRGVAWPAADSTLDLYRADWRHFARLGTGRDAKGNLDLGLPPGPRASR